MALPERSDRWDQLHEELRTTLQKEIFLMRELLANLHQEELSLMLQDHGTYRQLISQRSDMVEKLSHLRVFRTKTTQQIFALLGKKTSSSDYEQIFPDTEEISCEILNLRDQLMALTEKMNRQQTRNQHLTEHPEYLLSLHHQEKARQEQIRPKRKPIVATYHIKK
ncbi:MAG: hypothetical protein KF898_01820 [Parachlamydiales bacterium]|nr:hypothetical protein [Verrucomicrobiota bacterium]MBX3718368.1 hypothetical protein [Candidatus Acheromyda pituitae]